MLEIKVTIEAPELATAIDHLAAAMGTKTAQTAVAAPVAASPAPVQQPVAANPTPAPAPVQAGPAAGIPTNPQPGAVPLAAAPQYTVDQIMKAGATLMDAGRANDLMNLLRSFGVQAVTELKAEQYGAFVTALRNLGAKI